MMPQPWTRVFHADEVFNFQGATIEEVGLIMRLRWHCEAYNGIPNTEQDLIRIAKGIGLTRGKFRKLWQIVSEKFSEIDGFLFFTRDLEKRKEAQAEHAKAQETGRKGAEIRHANNERRQRYVPKTDVGPLENSDSYHHHHQSGIEVLSTYGGGTTPPTNARKDEPTVGRVVPPPATKQTPTPTAPNKAGEFQPRPAAQDTNPQPSPANRAQPTGTPNTPIPQPITDEDYQTFVVHCSEVRSPDGEQGVSLPSRKLCARIRAKFPHKSVAELVKCLPKYVGQHSPGMWDEISAERLELETLNQSIKRDVPRKPSESEQRLQRNLAWVRDRDEKRKAAGQ